MGYKNLCYSGIDWRADGLLSNIGGVIIDRNFIQCILFFVVLTLFPYIGAKLTASTDLPILCKTTDLCSTSFAPLSLVTCAEVCRLYKGL